MQGRVAWEDFQGGKERVGIREDILTSWRRSQLSGVNPQAVEFFRTDIDVESRFARIAIPLMNDMAELMAGTETCLAMANGSANVVWRWAPDSHLRTALDDAGLLVGHSFNEEFIGTNAVGTSLEIGRTASIRAEEHFRESFHRFNCVATPVIDPITHRALGTINLTWPPGYTEIALVPLVQKMAREVQSALRDAAGARERRLLQEFLNAKSKNAHPVVALNSEMIIGNHFASDPHFRHDALWARILEAVDSMSPGDLETLDGTAATVQAIFEGRSLVGAVLVFDRASAIESTSSLSTGNATGRVRVANTVASITREGGSVVLRGEVGVGKRTMLVDAFGHDEPVTVLDTADAEFNGTDAWLDQLGRALDEPRPVVIAHLDDLDQQTTRAVASTISHATSRPLIGATVTADPDQVPDRLASVIDALEATVIDLGPLKNRQEEIEPLARLFAGDLDITLDALDQLRRHPWPGNVSELRQVIKTAAASSDGLTIRIDNLPDHVRGAVWGNRHLSLLERAEAEVITRVLANAGGNKTVAARELGLSRPTLYSKIRSYRISSGPSVQSASTTT